MNNKRVTIIKPRVGWQFSDFQELYEYRDLFLSLVQRDIKVLYAQTILGFSWAILQPLIQIIIFTIIFGKVAKISTSGIPYILFASVAIIPWTYISSAMSQSSQSLIAGQNMLGKVYFPRIIFPFAPILARIVDFGISMVIIIVVSIYYRVTPTWNLIYFPLFFIIMIFITAGVGMLLASMAIRFRDVKHAMPFAIRMLMYTAPIVYSSSSIPETYHLLYSINPLVCVIEGFRACLLGIPIPWMIIWPGMISSILIFIIGAVYFKKTEHIFVDVI